MEINEINLINKARQGDREAFGSLYDSYLRRIYDFIYYRVSCQETAEDLTSDVFFKALDKIKSFDCNAKNSSFNAWLYRIARNRVIDYYRVNRSVSHLEEFENDFSDNGLSAEDLKKSQEQKAVLKYLDILKPEQKELVLLRVWDELSYKEIALIKGKSEASLKMSFSRAIKELRQKMPADLLLFCLLINLLK
jgi:RNA polymerase sigma-70 factor (ECF subfamily)